jgi:hypothetical protein
MIREDHRQSFKVCHRPKSTSGHSIAASPQAAAPKSQVLMAGSAAVPISTPKFSCLSLTRSSHLHLRHWTGDPAIHCKLFSLLIIRRQHLQIPQNPCPRFWGVFSTEPLTSLCSTRLAILCFSPASFSRSAAPCSACSRCAMLRYSSRSPSASSDRACSSVRAASNSATTCDYFILLRVGFSGSEWDAAFGCYV